MPFREKPRAVTTPSRSFPPGVDEVLQATVTCPETAVVVSPLPLEATSDEALRVVVEAKVGGPVDDAAILRWPSGRSLQIA